MFELADSTSGCNVACFFVFVFVQQEPSDILCSQVIFKSVFHRGEYVSGFAAGRFLLALKIYLLYRINSGIVKYY